MFVDDIDDEKQKLVEYRKNYSKIDKIKTGLFFYWQCQISAINFLKFLFFIDCAWLKYKTKNKKLEK